VIGGPLQVSQIRLQRLTPTTILGALVPVCRQREDFMLRQVISRRSALASAVLICVLGLSGCGGGGLTKENVGKLKLGMSRAEAESILGKGTELPKGDFMKDYTFVKWGDDNKSIMIGFNTDSKAAMLVPKGLPDDWMSPK
jgi:hypothetical protein